MAKDNSATTKLHLPWAGKQVSQGQVEEELTSLWHLAADNMRISQNMNVRASVLNFVICAQDEKTAYKASMLLRDLSSTHIARVTLLILDTSSESSDEVSTWITLRSFPIVSDVMRHHFEQVSIALHGTAIQYADTIVQTLLKPDLPVYLWWLNDLPAQQDIFQRLIKISSRVLIDSKHFSPPEKQIRAVSTILQETPQCALSDLNWGRVTAWRELIAQFSDVAEYRPYLMGIDTITIEHAVTPANQVEESIPTHNPIGALLLTAWLKTRLGWQLSDDDNDNYHDAYTGTYGWHMHARDMSRVDPSLLNGDTKNHISKPLQGIRISIQPREIGNAEPGTLCLVRLCGTAQGQQATFTIERCDDDEHVCTSVALPENTLPPRTVNVAATHKKSNLLHNELEITGRDHLYEEILHEVFALLERNK